MKKILLIGLAGTVLALIGRVSAAVMPNDAERRPMALLVFFDGGRADCLRNAECPNLKSLINGAWAPEYRGVWSDCARTQDDVGTLSWPNHLSILSGVDATVHKLRFNSWVESGRYLPQRSYLRALADQGIPAAAFFSAETDRLLADDGVVKIYEPPKRERASDSERDAAIAEIAASMLARSDAPQASAFFLGEPDGAGHYHGYYPSSREYLMRFDESDAHLGKVLAAIRSRPTFAQEDWLIAFITDHGGNGLRHGPHSGHCHTVPLVLSSRHVPSGLLYGTPRNVDLAPTMMAHFGIVPEPQMQGDVVGRRLSPCQPAARLEDGLEYSEDFNRPLVHAYDLLGSAVPEDPPRTYAYGYADEHVRVTNGMVMVNGKANPCSVRTRDTARVFEGAFTLAWWMYDVGETYKDNPPVLSNRNTQEDVIECSGAPAGGFSVMLESPTSPGGYGISLEYLGADDRVRRLGAFQTCVGEWTFHALVVRGDGAIVFYQGRPDGKLNWIADSAPGAKLAGLDLVLASDGAAEHFIGFHGGYDSVKLWSRPLAPSEVDALFRRGR